MKLTVLGAGCWGSALAWLLGDNFEEITIWGRKEDLSEEFLKTKKLTKPLEVQLPQKVQITSDLKEAIKDAKIILMVISTSGIRAVSRQLKEAGVRPDQILVNASKGLETDTLKRMSEVIKEELPENDVVVLSGPTLAKEVIDGLPTAASVACANEAAAKFVQGKLTVASKFRLYFNEDIIGVELGGSLKNVIAIASGFVGAMNLGDNARGAILTRGMAEIARISIALGAKPSTLYGLSGMGDLIATCSSPLSRNYSVGFLLGKGKKINDILSELGSVAEGVKTCEALCKLSKKLNVYAPLSNMIYQAIYTDISPEDAVKELINRDLKPE